MCTNMPNQQLRCFLYLILWASNLYKFLPSVATHTAYLSHTVHNKVLTSFDLNWQNIAISNFPLVNHIQTYWRLDLQTWGNGISPQLLFPCQVSHTQVLPYIDFLPLAFVSCICPAHVVFLHSVHTAVINSHNLLIRKAIVLETKPSFKLSPSTLPISHACTLTHTLSLSSSINK